MLRAVGPIEAVALLPWCFLARDNQARPAGALGRRERHIPLGLNLEPWKPTGGRRRRSWVWLERGRIGGLVSLRRRGSPRVWEIDCLVPPLEDEAFINFLDCFHLEVAKAGIERLFLRLPQDSPCLGLVTRAGFLPYRQDTLFHGRGRGRYPHYDVPGLRPKKPGDDHAIFRLFLTCAPRDVHQAEGYTFQEWLETREGGHGLREFVLGNGGNVLAWVRLTQDGGAGLLEVLAPPGEGDRLKGLLAACLSWLGRNTHVLVLAPGFQPGLRQILQQEGFEPVGELASLVKSVTAPVREPCIIPMQA